jgi:hypothetical protein
MSNGMRNQHYEDVLFELTSKGWPIRVQLCAGLAWIEIDTWSNFERARRDVWPRIANAQSAKAGRPTLTNDFVAMDLLPRIRRDGQHEVAELQQVGAQVVLVFGTLRPLVEVVAAKIGVTGIVARPSGERFARNRPKQRHASESGFVNHPSLRFRFVSTVGSRDQLMARC